MKKKKKKKKKKNAVYQGSLVHGLDDSETSNNISIESTKYQRKIIKEISIEEKVWCVQQTIMLAGQKVAVLVHNCRVLVLSTAMDNKPKAN